MFETVPAGPVTPPERDSVTGLDGEPTVVSLSDVHGYLADARSALLTLSDHPEFDPVVTVESGRVEWAGGAEYVLVFNGDLFDRGPDNDAVAAMVARLAREAPEGHVRVTLGNHEMAILTPDRFGWEGWYSAERPDDERSTFFEWIRDGLVVAAYEGYSVTYAHAGRPEPYDPAVMNDTLVAAATRLAETLEADSHARSQRAVIEAYPDVLGLGGRTGRGRGAGIAWLDFTHMPADAPPQVVGHTRHDEPRRKGNVICQNTIRNNRQRDGGEAVVVETPEELLAVVRTSDGDVSVRDL